MKPLASLALSLLVSAGCASGGFPAHTWIETQQVPADRIIEVGLEPDGSVAHVEFHVPPDTLPAEIRSAMDRAVPGGEIMDAEREWVGEELHYEITKRIAGREMEVLFDRLGNPVEWEIEIDASSAPPAVLAAADKAAGGTRTLVEEIRDADKKLTAYHVKKVNRGIRYKIVITPSGEVEMVFRETNAEIEVPVR